MRMNNKGFTLVELSIVLIIIGLLIAGVTSGKKLIQQAKISKVINEFSMYNLAVKTFETTYDALPGDFSKAADFWGSSGCGTGCSGDGDGLISLTGGTSREAYTSTYHLMKAEMISANLTFQTTGTMTPGSTIPASSWGGGSGYSIWGWSISVTGASVNVAAAVAMGAAISNGWNYFRVISPFNTYAIDNKMDDGMPNTGILRGASFPNADAGGGVVKECTTCNESTVANCHGASYATYKYDFSVTTNVCHPIYIIKRM